MALTFGAATSDRVECGAGASMGNLSAWTWAMWVRMSALTSARCLFFKENTGTPFQNKGIRLDGTAGNVRVNVQRTTIVTYTTNSTPLASVGSWVCFVCGFDVTGAAGDLVRIYTGGLDLNVAMAAATFGTATDASGAVQDDSAFVLKIGNRGANTQSLQGDIGPCALWNRRLSLAEAEAWRESFVAVGSGNVGLWDLGALGAATDTQPDLSGNGNDGTPTGTTRGQQLPIIVTPGAFALGGQAATPKAGFHVTAAQGSHALSGQNAALAAGFRAPADVGTFALSGVASLLAGYRAGADVGAFALAGQSANLLAAFGLPSSHGSFALAGQDAAFITGFGLGADTGTFALSGQAAGLTMAYRVGADQGTAGLSGQLAGLLAGYRTLADQAAFVLAGQSASLVSGYGVLAAQGAFVLSGQAATVRAAFILPSVHGSFVLSGQAASLRAGYRIGGDLANYVLTGGAATFPTGGSLIMASHGVYTVTGGAATITLGALYRFEPTPEAPDPVGDTYRFVST